MAGSVPPAARAGPEEPVWRRMPHGQMRAPRGLSHGTAMPLERGMKSLRCRRAAFDVDHWHGGCRDVREAGRAAAFAQCGSRLGGLECARGSLRRRREFAARALVAMPS